MILETLNKMGRAMADATMYATEDATADETWDATQSETWLATWLATMDMLDEIARDNFHKNKVN